MAIRWTGDPAADRLLEADGLALLIGLVLDQQVRMEKAFRGPFDLQTRLGHLDAAKIAAMPPEALAAVFRERPALHRFPGSMAARVQQLCAVVAETYGGDGAAVWTQAADGAELARRLAALPGFGPQKTRIAVSVVAKRLGVMPPGWEAHGADWVTIADVDSPGAMEEARVVKRQLKARAAGRAPRRPPGGDYSGPGKSR